MLFALLAGGLFFSAIAVNHRYSESSVSLAKKNILTATIPTASPALVPAGRNIAFESGNAIANAPASYLTILDCCESDEAIAERTAISELQAVLVKKTETKALTATWK